MKSPVKEPGEFCKKFEHALNSGDLEQILALYDDDAAMRAPGGRVSSGLFAVHDEMSRLIGANARIDNRLRYLLVQGDTALIIVDWTLDLVTPSRSEIRQTGTATNVLQFNPALGWRLIIANPYGVA